MANEIEVETLLKLKIQHWLRENDLGTDVYFYSMEEWEDRGEPFGNSAILSMTFEGNLYTVINCGFETREGQALYEEFVALPEEFGLYVDFGHAWSAHFYHV